MSKTDKTDPYWVKRKRSKIESHDHRDGICSIDFTKESWLDCHLEVDWYDPQNRCGCPMCSDQDGRKAKARKQRYEGRKYARDWQKEY